MARFGDGETNYLGRFTAALAALNLREAKFALERGRRDQGDARRVSSMSWAWMWRSVRLTHSRGRAPVLLTFWRKRLVTAQAQFV